MTYVVAGVSGHTGKVVAETLLAKGAKIRVLVRDASKGQAWAERGAEVAVADLHDVPALTKALTGAEGAYLLLPPNMAAPDFRAYQLATGEAIVQAVRAAKVPHLVLLSSIGAHLEKGTGPIAGLHPLENGLRALPDTRSTFLRASYFAENLGGSLGGLAAGVYPTFIQADIPVEMIATRDIGLQAAGLLLQGATETRVVELAGPRAYTQNDIAQILSKLTGKDVSVQQGPTAAMSGVLQGYGFPAGLAGLYVEMTEALNTGLLKFEGKTALVRGETGVDVVLKGFLSK